MYDFYNPPKIVVGESTPGAGEALLGLYAGIEAPVIRTNIRWRRWPSTATMPSTR